MCDVGRSKCVTYSRLVMKSRGLHHHDCEGPVASSRGVTLRHVRNGTLFWDLHLVEHVGKLRGENANVLDRSVEMCMYPPRRAQTGRALIEVYSVDKPKNYL